MSTFTEYAQDIPRLEGNLLKDFICYSRRRTKESMSCWRGKRKH